MRLSAVILTTPSRLLSADPRQCRRGGVRLDGLSPSLPSRSWVLPPPRSCARPGPVRMRSRISRRGALLPPRRRASAQRRSPAHPRQRRSLEPSASPRSLEHRSLSHRRPSGTAAHRPPGLSPTLCVSTPYRAFHGVPRTLRGRETRHPHPHRSTVRLLSFRLRWHPRRFLRRVSTAMRGRSHRQSRSVRSWGRRRRFGPNHRRQPHLRRWRVPRQRPRSRRFARRCPDTGRHTPASTPLRRGRCGRRSMRAPLDTPLRSCGRNA
jgi:hypothetical protein